MDWIVTAGDFDSAAGHIARVHYDGVMLRLVDHSVHHVEPHLSVHGKGFTGGCFVEQGRLIVCGFNALYVVDVPSLKVVETVASTRWNDLHHVCAHRGRLWLANTGHDRVEVVGFDGALYETHTLKATAQLLPDVSDPYYQQDERLPIHRRKLIDQVHPNYLYVDDERALVTRFACRQVEDLYTRQIVIAQTPGAPHDARVIDGALWLSCTNGIICRYTYDGAQYVLCARYHIFELSGRLGWCRGLSICGDLMLVGLTRITRMPKVRWGDWPFAQTTTSLVLIDWRREQLISILSLDALAGHPKVFDLLTLTRDD